MKALSNFINLKNVFFFFRKQLFVGGLGINIAAYDR